MKTKNTGQMLVESARIHTHTHCLSHTIWSTISSHSAEKKKKKTKHQNMLRLIEVNISGNLFFRSRFSFPVFRPFCWLLLRIAFAQSPLNIRNACCIRFRMSSFLFLSIIYTNRCRFVMFVVVSGRAIFSLRSSAFIRPYVRKIRK